MVPLTNYGCTCPLDLMLSTLSLALTNVFLPGPQFELTKDHIVTMHCAQILYKVHPYSRGVIH